MRLTFRSGAAATIAAVFAVLLLARLGHYSLWDDEALTAMGGQVVWETGDTSGVIGHNLMAHRNGAVLVNLHDRSTPPLPAYWCAPFVGLMGNSSFAARLPFALFGLGTLAVLLRWMWRTDADRVAWIVLGIALVGNVSLILYSRNARYYAPAIFFSAWAAYLYVFYDGRVRNLLWLVVASIGLLATQYICFVALYVVLGVDYLLWGRQRHRLAMRDWLILLLPILLVGVPMVWIWNPLRLELGQNLQTTPLAMKLGLVWLNLRDMNQAEFAPLILLAVAPLLYPITRNVWLLRGSVALIVYVLAGSLLSPQRFVMDWPFSRYNADLRYIVPVLPLAIAMAVLALCQLRGRLRIVAVGLAVLAFWTNFPHRLPGVRFDRHEYSSLLAYFGELSDPPPDPYAPVADWLNEHATPGQSAWVLPDYMAYPLMYHAPKVVYAWQLSDPLPFPEQFAGLPDIHFHGRVMPDYLILFGPRRAQLPPGAAYDLVATANVYWQDAYRPELFWRRFEPIPVDLAKGEGVYILRRR
jgi:hypothetical protein